MSLEILESNEHTFETIAGQDLVKRFLEHACDHGRLPQALLFTGPAGVGKRSLMFALAKRLVTRDLEPGGGAAERARGKVARGTHPDVLVIEPKSASGQILKEQVDEMHDRAHYAPLEARCRVILINPVEAMNLTAANNLLKLLEEPPPALYLLLGSRQIHKTLPTIRSRCALLRCPPVEFEPLLRWLMEKTGCLRRRAETAVRLAGGRPGLALSLLSGKDEERRRRICGELEFFDQHGYASIFRVAHNLIGMADGPREALSLLMLWFRDLLVASLALGGPECGVPSGPERGESTSSTTSTPSASSAESTHSASSAESLLINRDLLPEVVQAAGSYTPRKLARALGVLLAEQERNASPFVDSDLLFQVLLTNLGVALKSA